MRSVLFLSAAAGLVAAAPQNVIDFAALNALPSVAQGPAVTAVSQAPSYNPTAAASSAAAAATSDPVASLRRRRVSRRDNGFDCHTIQAAGYAPVSSPDTVDAFLANQDYQTTASKAAVPQGYDQVFSNLQGSTSQGGYMGLYTMASYDTIKCQQYCDAAAGCTAFNVFIERDPSVNPADACPNPASAPQYRCTLWGLPICDDTATNKGQWREDFQVVVTASNGYVKLPQPPPLVNGVDTYIGNRIIQGPFDPSQCAAICQATTQFDAENLADASGAYKPCNFFVSYVVAKNNSPLGTYCAFYTQAWGSQYGTNNGQYDSEGNYYSVSQAYSYTLTIQDPGVLGSSSS
ncbi:hypothetical protein H2203_001196 [Taxawa tesnikishii (nom. ined.)]|nr:hypothetical protein H2203_001196 [Dothideales sp. JES 119]